MKRSVVLAGLTFAALGLGLGVAALGGGTDGSTAAGDRAALEKNVRSHVGSLVRPYTKLKETLPNAKDRDGVSVNDSVIIGRVESVQDGAGYVESGQPPTAGHAGARTTNFNDPLADWRTMRVVFAVQETLAGEAVDQLVVSWPLMGSILGGEDKDAMGRALKDLGEVVVFSTARPSSPEFLGIAREIPDREYGLAVLAADDTLRFPFVGDGAAGAAKAAEFTAGVDTLADLRTAAKSPIWTRSAG